MYAAMGCCRALWLGFDRGMCPGVKADIPLPFLIFRHEYLIKKEEAQWML
jgi:hypothetical protein